MSGGDNPVAHTLFLVQIEAAKEAIGDAEAELEDLVGDIVPASRADKTEVSEGVRAAASKLRAAKAKLVDLKAELVDLEASMALAKLEAARTAVTEAERQLDGVIGEIVVVAGADTAWMGKPVKDAFAKLRAARMTLDELASGATDDD